MDLTVAPELQLLRSSVRDLFEAACPPQRVIELWERGAFDSDLWDRVAAMGLAGILVPEPAGHDLGVEAAVVVVQEAGRVLAPVPLASSIVGAWLAATAGAPSDVVQSLVSGAERPALVQSEQASLVRDATVATVLLSIRPDGTLELIRLADAPSAVTSRLTAGRQREGSVDLRGLPTKKIGAIRPEVCSRLQALRITLEAAEISGACHKVLELSVAHVLARHQFGKALAAFQAVQHRMADMLTDLDAIRWLCLRTAAELDAGRDASYFAECLAVVMKERSSRVIASALQVHGGVGFIRDHPLHMYFGRQKATELSFGLASAHRERIAAALLDAEPSES